ncbi:hypothetical protein [Serratia sp. TSA_105.2]|uniref:hypothetical protein n=1 Tax=Serratia sp. TSA_105.2 TaxID=3415660 RepID=UPI004046C3A0
MLIGFLCWLVGACAAFCLLCFGIKSGHIYCVTTAACALILSVIWPLTAALVLGGFVYGLAIFVFGYITRSKANERN